MKSDEVKKASLERYFLPPDLCCNLLSKICSLLYAGSNGTLRFAAMRRLRAVTCGPGRRSTSVMLGHACKMLAVMYLQ